jgi:hypothetical protein
MHKVYIHNFGIEKRYQLEFIFTTKYITAGISSWKNHNRIVGKSSYKAVRLVFQDQWNQLTTASCYLLKLCQKR